MFWFSWRKFPFVADGETAAQSKAVETPYVPRRNIELKIAKALEQNENLVIYGPPHQGKTTLLLQQLQSSEVVYIDCRPDFKRPEIYRIVLTALGYSVVVEKKRKGKAKTSIQFGVFSSKVAAEAEGEMEQVAQSVTADLKNPSEVAHLISRIKRVPHIVFNNFQLLDAGVKEKLLFDLSFFAERSAVRFTIVGTWYDEAYLEEIEPSLAGKFTHVHVPMWTEAELRQAFTQWTRGHNNLQKLPDINDFLLFSGGDISLFQALWHGAVDGPPSLPPSKPGTESQRAAQEIILERFGRALIRKLRDLLDMRDNYLTYHSISLSSAIAANPDFEVIKDARSTDYDHTLVDPITREPYPNGRAVRLDARKRPEYRLKRVAELTMNTVGLTSFLLSRFHAAVHNQMSSIPLDQLAESFIKTLEPKPMEINLLKLKSAFVQFGNLQRKAMLIPPILTVDAKHTVMEIADRRFLLFLQGLSEDALAEILEEIAPGSRPDPRRRNHIGSWLTEEQEKEYRSKALAADTKNPKEKPVIAESEGDFELD